MPELPEVETVAADLRKKIVGRKIVRAWTDWPKTIKRPAAEDFLRKIKGAKIEGVARRGKNILISLNKDRLLLVHQKMTGHLLVGRWLVGTRRGERLVKPVGGGALAEPVNRFIHLIFYLDNGQMVGLSDMRKFAKVMLGSRSEILTLPEISGLGPEPLGKDLSADKFVELILGETRRIKQVLLDQEVVAGIGNIYADDILWYSRIHPLRRAHRLKREEIEEIFRRMRELLKKSIRLRGASMSDFRDTAGRPGGYGPERLAYQREDEPCRRCGRPIRRIKLGGRSTHYCSNCQKQ